MFKKVLKEDKDFTRFSKESSFIKKEIKNA